MLPLAAEVAPTEYKINRAHHAQGGPQVVEAQRLAHEEYGERQKYAQRDDLLQDLQLPDIELREADAVRRHLQQILEQGDAPADERRNNPGPGVQFLEMPVPREGH